MRNRSQSYYGGGVKLRPILTCCSGNVHQYLHKCKHPNLSSDTGRADALLKGDRAISEQARQEIAEARVLTAKLNDIVRREYAEETNKLLVAKSRVSIAETDLDDSPTGEDYFADFSPAVTQKAVSNADGKFAFTYRRDKTHTLYASAQRAIANKTERYYWLIDAPTNAETAQIVLEAV